MRTAGEAVNLPDTTLLHAGPAFSHPSQIVQPVLNSAKVALVFNGAAQDFEEAAQLVLSGAITLEPAQDYDVVTPLAAVVFAPHPATVTCLVVMSSLLVWRHRANVRRLVAGTESRIGQKSSG